MKCDNSIIFVHDYPKIQNPTEFGQLVAVKLRNGLMCQYLERKVSIWFLSLLI